MDTQRLSAVLLIAAGVGIMLTTFTNAPGLYETQDVAERLRIIEAHRPRWLASQGIVSLAALLLAGGFGLLAWKLRSNGGTWTPVVGAMAIAAGSLSALYFVYLQTVDPRGGYSGQYPLPEELAYWLWLGGQLLFGIAFLQVGLPSWLGYLTGGAALAYAIVFFLTGAGFVTPFLLALISMAIGIVLLRA
jgi:hypothetical protein